MLRNREMRYALGVWVACTIALGLCGWRAFGPWGSAFALGACVIAALPFLALTSYRYRALARMSERIDAVLHGERDLDFSTMTEGELAILGSEVGKVIARLNLTVDELAREKQALADALADISHQIKTPLTSLSITTELVRKHLAELPECAEDLDRLRRIEQLERRVENLVSALLKLARLDAGVIRLTHEEVRVSDVIASAVQPLAVALDIAEVSLEVVCPDSCTFTGDLAWTAEALGNIVKNCMEHTPAGSTVRIETWEDALACRIRVTDEGPGFSEADLPHVFERFYRGTHGSEESSAVNPTGIGIGLSLAQSLIAAQDGTLTASNARGTSGEVAGAQFDIAFFKAVV